MNRPIKFRAWDKANKKMINSFVVNAYDGMIFDGTDFLYDCELMQFTGLYDKNGKGIFEGDLGKMQGACESIYKIQWSDEWGKAGFVIKGILPYGNKRVKFSSDYLNPQYANEIEVIDVYEHPNLLTTHTKNRKEDEKRRI